MNLKTTIALILLVGAGIGAYYWIESRKPGETAASPTLDFLKTKLTAEKLTHVEVTQLQKPRELPPAAASAIGFLNSPLGPAPRPTTLFILEKKEQEWNLPGNWPVRPHERDQWLAVLTKLSSRFAPIAIEDSTDLKPYGLDETALTIKVTIDEEPYTLRFGEEPETANRLNRLTYVRLGKKNEVIQVGPGVYAALHRTLDHFRLRTLFPSRSVAKDKDAKDQDSRDKVEELDASAVEVATNDAKFTLVHRDNDWILLEAHKKVKKAADKKSDKVKNPEKDADQGAEKVWQRVSAEDRLDPARRDAVLRAFPELWAVKFVDEKSKSLTDCGLKEPAYTISLTRTNGTMMKVEIGKVSSKKAKTPKMPPPNPFEKPPKPPEEHEELRYAKLAGNDQLFEIRADKLTDIAASIDDLRDPQLARFKIEDVVRLDMRHGETEIVLVKTKEKEKEKWRIENADKEDADTRIVDEVLQELRTLRATDQDILDPEAKLDPPQGRIKLRLEEADKDAKKTDAKDEKKKTREIIFHLGVKDTDKDKLFVKVDSWPRVNRVNDDLWKLVQRPALAYRHRRVLDLAAADLIRIEIQRADESFAFAKKDDLWKLTTPVDAEVEDGRLKQLVNELAKLEGVELIGTQAKPEELDKTYGLAKPALTVKLHSKAGKEHTLILGNARTGKPEYYARVDAGPIFTLPKPLHDELDRRSLTYRPKQIWRLDRESITQISVKADEPGYTLKRDGNVWKISGPLEAEAQSFAAESLAHELSQLRCERFETHRAEKVEKYGLDKAAYTLSISTNDGKPRVLEIGKRTEPAARTRFARVDGSDAVFVLNDELLSLIKSDPLDLLDKRLLTLKHDAIQRIQYAGTSKFALEAKKDHWQVIDSPAAPFKADDDAMKLALVPWQFLHAEKFVKYGAKPKIDWAQYGLDKPAATVTATFKSDDSMKDKKPVEHVIELGKEVEKGARYARVDGKDAVVVLDVKFVEALQRTYLDFVDTRVLTFDFDAVMAIRRQMAGADIELTKQEDNWLMTKPMMRDADNITVRDMLERTFRLRAQRVAAYPAKDLQPFGLDKPVAVVTLQLDTGKHVIKVGNLAKDAARKDTDERFAIINDNPAVVVLSAELSRHLVGPMLYYVDRNLVSFANVDSAELTRGARKLSFSHEARWQMVQPIKTDAEDAALNDLIASLRRLRADEIVAEKGADLKKFGLDQPYLQWRFKQGDADKLHLLVGAPENDKPGARRYAKLGDKETVFLLSTKVTAKLLAEYRGRSPWPPLDVAQVDEATVVSPDKKFTLTKKGNRWSVAGEFDVIVKAPVVTDTLDALASLKVSHYVADEKADLQLYGLTTPAWKIELQTPTGKRELWLGRHEGVSKRYYATTPGSGTVFVLDEIDSVRIARPLSAFVEVEKKK